MSDASNVVTFRSASVRVLTNDERQLIIDALKISKISSVSRHHNLLTSELANLIERVEKSNQVWLTTTTTKP